MPEIAAVILAAGKSTRMKSKFPKAVHLILGKPMAQYVVDAVREAGAKRVVAVIGHGADQVKNALGASVEYAVQAEQLGSGHAAMQAEAVLHDFTGTLMVLPADTPLLSSESLGKMIELHQRTGAAATVLTAVLEEPAAYGRVVRSIDGSVARIVEARDAVPEVLAVREINTSVYCFDAALLFEKLRQVQPENAQGEYYLTDVIGLLVADGRKVEAIAVDEPETAIGINNRVELAEAAEIMRRRVLNRLMLSGVTIEDPNNTYIEPGVEIGQDTIVKPMTVIKGKTRIGEDCIIGPSAQITDSVIGDRVLLNSSVVDESEVGSECRIGPWSRLRPGNKIGMRVTIGNYAELKKSTVADDAHVHHVSYLGDATVGTRVNIGAGTITCNFNGITKNPTRIGDDAFIGSDTMLVAPVSIGENAATGAGSVVTKDVPDNALVVGVPARFVRQRPPRRKTETGNDDCQ